MDLTRLKSARVIEDPDEAFTLVSRAHAEAAQSPVGRKGQTLFERAKDGSLAFRKAVDLSLAGAGAPAMPAKDELKALVEKRGMKWDPRYFDRMKSWWASDERVDAHGDIVLQEWFFDEFEKNSPMPFNHGWGGLSVGRHVDWRVLQRKSDDYEGAALWVCGVFALPETDPEADRVHRHVDAGLLPACSVGFYSKKVIDVKDEEERKKLGLGRYGYLLGANHLLEVSPTMIGANPGALTVWQNAKARGLLKPEDIPHLRELQRRAVVRGAGDVEAWTAADRDFRALSRLLFPDLEVRPHEELDAPIVGEDPAKKAKAYTPPEEKAAATKTIEEKLDALMAKQAELTAAYNESMLSISSQMNDIRTMLEDLTEGAARVDAASPEEGGSESESSEDETKTKNSRVTRLVLRGLTHQKKA